MRSSRCWRPTLRACGEQLERALAEGTPYLILDGTIVDADRCREKTQGEDDRLVVLGKAG